MKGVFDPLVSGVSAGRRQRQGRRRRRRLREDDGLLVICLLDFILFILLLRVSVLSTERGLGQKGGALVLLDGLVQGPQLAQQRHVQLSQTDLSHTKTSHLFFFCLRNSRLINNNIYNSGNWAPPLCMCPRHFLMFYVFMQPIVLWPWEPRALQLNETHAKSQLDYKFRNHQLSLTTCALQKPD